MSFQQWALSNELWALRMVKRLMTHRSLLATHRSLPKNSFFELLRFLNARIREFVGECGIAGKDAICQELSKKL